MKSVLLIVLDGFGIAPATFGNAIHQASPAFFNSLLYTFPNTTLKASGEAVGLPSGEVGNTEVGHINLGAGRIVYQDLPRINMAIADGSFYSNPALLKVVEHCKTSSGKLHVIGLVGQGTVHSSIEHLYALMYFAKEHGIKELYIHAVTDGRDSPPKSAEEIIGRLEEKLHQNGVGKIASIMGRYYGMDRDRRWERIEKAYNCLTKGEGNHSESALAALKQSYEQNITDEFVLPTLIHSQSEQPTLISANDAVIFFNFRIDRPRELTKAFVLDDFENQANTTKSFDPYAVKYYKTHQPKEQILNTPFHRGNKIENLLFVTMTEYEEHLPVEVAFPPIPVNSPVGRVLSEHSVDQLRMSESEKERFVTFYFNGLRDMPFGGEDRLIIPSPKVATYDLQPQMSAIEIKDVLLKKLREQKYGFILVNFANPDMVGHTGNIQATIAAIQTIDLCLREIVTAALNLDVSVLITADHGNAEQKINPHTGGVSTEHTDNPVPFIAINRQLQGKYIRLQSGILADVAPTILALLEVPKPSDMTGRNLLEEIH